MDEEDVLKTEAGKDDAATRMISATVVDFERPATLVGQTLDGRFIIEKNLADTGADAGGIGLVYLAADIKLMGKEVVVKILQETALKHPDVVRKFLHEKEALIRLDHPGIVRILDSGTLTDGNPFMVMEFIEGHSLRKELQNKGQLPLDVAAHLIESITDALAAAHSKNIIHRDIKPENIMLTPQEDGYDRVRIIDFGIARVGDSELAPATQISRAIGTVMYIAPEQLIGSLELTPAVDIYAAAIVAYEMLTGDWPFKPKTIVEMYQIEKDGVKVPPSDLRPDLPPVAEKILLSALEFESDKRPQNARAFGRYLAGELRRDAREATDEFYASLKTEWARLPTEHTIPPDTGDMMTVVAPHVERKKPNSNLKFAAIAVVVLALLAIPAGYMFWNPAKPGVGPAPVASPGVTDHELSYFLNVQKMRDGKPFEAPFKSSGQEVFESGYKFSMVFQPDADGYMYVFNEGKDEQGNVGYYILFPTPSINNGSAQVSTGQPIETKQNTFGGAKGTEVMWLIWTKDKRDDIDALARSAFDQHGTVKDQDSGTLKAFLDRSNAVKPESIKDSANQRTLVKAKGDIVVQKFELEHR